MSQTRVYEFLSKRKGKYFSTLQIADELDLNQNTISLNMRSLLKWRMVTTCRINHKTYYAVD